MELSTVSPRKRINSKLVVEPFFPFDFHNAKFRLIYSFHHINFEGVIKDKECGGTSARRAMLAANFNETRSK
jgi:hypothetical protein